MHGLNDKTMLEEVVRELTARNNDKQTTSKGCIGLGKKNRSTMGTSSYFK